jgi:hypothetical protein
LVTWWLFGSVPKKLKKGGDVMSELCSLGQMAGEIGVTQGWLRTEADAGRVPCLRAGKRYLFSPEAVFDVLARLAARPGRDNEKTKVLEGV